MTTEEARSWRRRTSLVAMMCSNESATFPAAKKAASHWQTVARSQQPAHSRRTDQPLGYPKPRRVNRHARCIQGHLADHLARSLLCRRHRQQDLGRRAVRGAGIDKSQHGRHRSGRHNHHDGTYQDYLAYIDSKGAPRSAPDTGKKKNGASNAKIPAAPKPVQVQHKDDVRERRRLQRKIEETETQIADTELQVKSLYSSLETAGLAADVDAIQN